MPTRVGMQFSHLNLIGLVVANESYVVEISDESDFVDSAKIHKRLENTAQSVLTQLNLAPGCELSISLVELSAMEKLHVEYMGEPGATDVLSFPMDEVRIPVPGEVSEAGLLGDVVLCPAFVEKQARDAGNTFEAEMDMLLIHGILHLLGHDHAEPEEHAVMFALQSRLLEQVQTGAKL